MADYDKFFDEDGNLVMTQKDIDRLQAEREQQEKEQEQQRRREMIELNKNLELDEKSQEIAKKYRDQKKRQETLKKWAERPEWLRNMKVTPLSAPPTEGTKEMLLYKLTKKVELTSDERKRREKQAKNLAQALNDHNKIHQELPPGSPLAPVTVVSVSHGTGGTTMTRCLSAAMQMSRYDFGNSFSVDMSFKNSEFAPKFGKSFNNSVMRLRLFLKAMRDKKYASLDPTTIIPASPDNPREYFLDNLDKDSFRVEPGIADVVDFYNSIRGQEGFLFFDCDYYNMDALMGSMILSNTVIFVVEPLTDNIHKVQEIIDRYKLFVDEDPNSMQVIDNAKLVIMANDKRFMTKNNLHSLKRVLNKMAGELSIEQESTYLVPFDKSLGTSPLSFNNANLYTAHVIRSIAGEIVEDAIRRNTR